MCKSFVELVLYFIFVLWWLIFVNLPRFAIICTSGHVSEGMDREWDLNEKKKWSSYGLASCIQKKKSEVKGVTQLSTTIHLSQFSIVDVNSVNNHSYSHWYAFPTMRDYWISSIQEPKVSLHFFKLFLFAILSKQQENK